jgi:pimeloyl-ACP methyl ester carboxylesterase
MRRTRRLLSLLAAVILACCTVYAAGTGAHAQATPRPIIFVHGFFGSGSQFETQAKRFASNGYPASYIETQDYDSTFLSNSREQVYTWLDQRIARLKAATGADKVDLAGHSLGTSMSQGYLTSSATRAANVAHYVNLDGFATSSGPPAGIPTLAVWGEGNTDANFPGATNVHLNDQSHVQVSTSAETFAAMYRFLTGEAPQTTDVAPQPGTIQLAGRAVTFPDNVGINNARVEVFELDPATGRPRSTQPVATFTISQDGAFGPFNGRGDAYYEFRLTRGDTERRHHLYFAPFRRTDLNIRLLSQNPGSWLDLLIERNAQHSALLAYRNKEWWGDQGAASDRLTINGTSVLSSQVTPRSKRAIGIFAFDAGSDRRSNVTSVPGLMGLLPFITGTDLYLPASSTASGTITLETTQRGNGRQARIAVPNWPSTTDMITVTFDDY